VTAALLLTAALAAPQAADSGELDRYLLWGSMYFAGQQKEAIAGLRLYDALRYDPPFQFVERLREEGRLDPPLIKRIAATALVHLDIARLAGETRPTAGNLALAHRWVDLLHKIPETKDIMRRLELAAAYVLHGEWALYGLRNHLDRARALFRDDADLLVASAALWESCASPKMGGATPPGLPRPNDALARAERDYRAALTIDPAHAEARLRLGRVLFRRGKHDAALAELNAAQQNVRLRYVANLFTGAVHEETQRFGEAVAAYRAAIKVCPECPVARLALSHAVRSAGDRDEATALARDAIKPLLPDGHVDPWSFYDYGPSWRLDELLAQLRRDLTP